MSPNTRSAFQGRPDLLERVMDTSPAGIVLVDADGVLRYANEHAEAILGLTLSEMTDRTYDDPAWKSTDLEGGPWPDEKQPFMVVSRTLKPAFGIQHAIEWPDGERVLLSINAAPLLNEAGEFEGMVAALENITERVEMTRALVKSREEYRLLMENAVSGVGLHDIILDESGTPVDFVFLDVNPAFERITGLVASDIIGKRASEVLPGIEDTPFLESYGQVVLTGVPATLEEYSEALGKYFHVNAYRVIEGRFATVFQDITGRVEAEEARASLEEQLRQAQKMEAVGRLAGGIAHDFNNMLQTILGNAEMLLAEFDANPAVTEPLSEVRKAARRSAELTRQLMAFARLQASHPRILELSETVGGLLGTLGSLLRGEVSLSWAPGPVPLRVSMDPAQVEELLANLLTNARDAIPGAGRVTVATDLLEVEEAHCADHPEAVPGGYAVLSVSDDGPGMDPDTRSRIFEPFFSTKPARGGDAPGAGLGLASVYGIVTQNHGFVEVESEPGAGSTFRLFLPLKRDEE